MQWYEPRHRLVASGDYRLVPWAQLRAARPSRGGSGSKRIVRLHPGKKFRLFAEAPLRLDRINERRCCFWILTSDAIRVLMGAVTSDRVLVDRIRAGDNDAWRELVERYEGRLLAFVEPRVTTVQDAEDIVQETFVGFLLNLPNFDSRRDLGAYLFAIAAHKLTDWLRRKGRKPWDSASSDASGRPLGEVGGKARSPSAIVRSREGHTLEEEALTDALRELIQRLKETGQYDRLRCIELLFVRGWRNKDVAAATGLTEQQVANFKFQTIRQLQSRVGAHPALKALEEAEKAS